MSEIFITVADKIATVQGNPTIICGNSDYKISFAFDAEWNTYTSKTVRYTFYSISKGSFQTVNKLFQGNSVEIPPLPTTRELQVMIYAGDIHTSSPVKITCTGTSEISSVPSQDVYQQLMEYLAGLQGGGKNTGISELEFIGTHAARIGIAETEEE